MTEQEQTASNENDGPAANSAATSVKKGTGLIALVILLSLTWYLVADRFTPYTSQARVQGYVIGVAPKVAGVVTEVWVSNNLEVQADQRLFQIDPSQYEIALGKAQADLDNALSQVAAGDAGVESARANLRAAQANRIKAGKDANRLQRLYQEDPGTISVRRLEIAQASRAQARAQVDAAEAEIQRALEQSAVEKATLDLENTVVRASSRGIVTDLRADVGQYAGTGAPVMTLIAIHDVWIDAEFTENNLGHLRPGSRVEILFDVVPGRVFAGEVRSIGVGVSVNQPPPPGTLPTIENNRDWLRQSQRFPVVIGFKPGEHEALHQQLRIGGQASVIAYAEGHGILELLGKGYIRLLSLLSYAY